MAHIRIKYVEPMCTLYNPYRASWNCFDDEEGDGESIRCCPGFKLKPTKYTGEVIQCEYASRKEIEKEGNFKSWTLEKDGENMISLLLGKTYIEGDDISYLEIDGRVLVEEIMKADELDR